MPEMSMKDAAGPEAPGAALGAGAGGRGTPAAGGGVAGGARGVLWAGLGGLGSGAGAGEGARRFLARVAGAGPAALDADEAAGFAQAAAGALAGLAERGGVGAGTSAPTIDFGSSALARLCRGPGLTEASDVSAVLDLLAAPAPCLLDWDNVASLTALRALEHPLLTLLAGPDTLPDVKSGVDRAAAVAAELLLRESGAEHALVWVCTEAQGAQCLLRDMEILETLLERVARAAADRPFIPLRDAYGFAGPPLPGTMDLLGCLVQEPALVLFARGCLRRWWLSSGHPRFSGLLGLLVASAMSCQGAERCDGVYWPRYSGSLRLALHLSMEQVGEHCAASDSLERALAHVTEAGSEGHTLETCPECSRLWSACIDFPCFDFSLLRDLMWPVPEAGFSGGGNTSQLAEVLAWKLWPRHPRERADASTAIKYLARKLPAPICDAELSEDPSDFQKTAAHWLGEVRSHEHLLGAHHARVLWPLALLSGRGLLESHGEYLLSLVVSPSEESFSAPALRAVLDLCELWPEWTLRDALLKLLRARAQYFTARLGSVDSKDFIARLRPGLNASPPTPVISHP